MLSLCMDTYVTYILYAYVKRGGVSIVLTGAGVRVSVRRRRRGTINGVVVDASAGDGASCICHFNPF